MVLKWLIYLYKKTDEMFRAGLVEEIGRKE